MDLAYWGFRHWPFERTWSAARFFAGSLHEEALARLMFVLEEQRRLGIVLGPVGTGKTYLLRLLQHRAERMGRFIVRCDAMGADGNELAAQVAVGCHVDCEPDASPAKIWSGIKLRLESMAIIRQSLVVIIDHVDFVPTECLRTIARLNQLADAVGVTMTILIATREQEIARSLCDFMDLKIELGPWTVEECVQFISAATLHAGSNRVLFTDEAVQVLHDVTQGVPSRLVSLCNLSLLAARECDEECVTHEIVNGLLNEIRLASHGAAQQPRFESNRPLSIN